MTVWETDVSSIGAQPPSERMAIDIPQYNKIRMFFMICFPLRALLSVTLNFTVVPPCPSFYRAEDRGRSLADQGQASLDVPRQVGGQVIAGKQQRLVFFGGFGFVSLHVVYARF